MVTASEITDALKQLSAIEVARMLGQDFVIALTDQLDDATKARLFGRSHLSNTAILRNLETGNIVIDPFDPRNLKGSTYDVRLGQYYFEEHDLTGGRSFFNPYDETDVRRVWGNYKEAIPARNWLRDNQYTDPWELANIHPDDFIIPIRPGGTILAHTIEFIGGRNGIMTSHMKARSSFGRCFIEVCKCAGEGDPGFFSRWTMEFTNNSTDKTIPLVVGRRIAQVIFMQVEPVTGDSYAANGKYQLSDLIDEVKRRWSPEDMLPKLWKDWEVQEKILGTKFLSA